MTESELKKIIASVLETDVGEVEKNVEKEWDSLAHLSILMALESQLSGQIGIVEGIGESLTYMRLASKLRQGGLLK